MLRIASRPTRDLSASEKEAVMRVMSETFSLDVPVEQIANYYCSNIPRVLLGYSQNRLVGFQFYQECTVDDVNVLHFSLAGKSDTYPVRGLQRAFGAALVRRGIRRMMVNPFRPIAIAGVSNNPKSYRNMLLIGGSVFPDVTNPGRPFSHGALYARVAQRLGIGGLDVTTGVVRNRCAALGFRIKASAFEARADAINHGFMNYIDGDVNHGVFTMAVSTPFTAVTSFARRQLGRKT